MISFQYKRRSPPPEYIILYLMREVHLWKSSAHAEGPPTDIIIINLQYKRGTLFETENERQKTKPVPIPLPRASRNFPNVKTRNGFFFYNWTSEIIPFIGFGKQMDRTYIFF